MKKQYIIVGDNNFWYAIAEDTDATPLEKEIQLIKEGIEQNIYEHGNKPTELYAYEITGFSLTYKPNGMLSYKTTPIIP